MEKDIYNLKLHETMDIENDTCIIKVMRVPGGWNYIYFSPSGKSMSVQNIAYDNNEFQDKAKTLGELFPPEN